MTNRELYLLVTSFKEKIQSNDLPELEDYLHSLWQIVADSNVANPTIDNVAQWLETAFAIRLQKVKFDWSNYQIDYKPEIQDFKDWESVIISQIADLTAMRAVGQFENEYRYFGISSPNNTFWYNFDPLTYLECGVRGTFGGYEAAEVIVLIEPPEGESADSTIFEIADFSWQDFADILENGRLYE